MACQDGCDVDRQKAEGSSSRWQKLYEKSHGMIVLWTGGSRPLGVYTRANPVQGDLGHLDSARLHGVSLFAFGFTRVTHVGGRGLTECYRTNSRPSWPML